MDERIMRLWDKAEAAIDRNDTDQADSYRILAGHVEYLRRKEAKQTQPHDRGRPVTEKHVRYTEDVDSLAAAWTFVLTHVDEFSAPTIGIEAYSQIVQDQDGTYGPGETGWTASIHGTVNA